LAWKAHVLAFSRSLTSSSNGDRPIRSREDRMWGRIHPAATAAGILLGFL